MWKIKAFVAIGSIVMVLGALTPPANALASAGASANCDFDGHCVSGGATSTNAGVTTSTTGSESQVGTAVAVCHGSAPGATIIEITCAIGQNSRTMSFPGGAGAVPVVTTTGQLERLPVCWSVTAIFPVITGAPHNVSTSGCAILAV